MDEHALVIAKVTELVGLYLVLLGLAVVHVACRGCLDRDTRFRIMAVAACDSPAGQRSCYPAHAAAD
jgi:hypothetical protein